MVPDLVYDVGVNNGDDTAYYLKRGYRVVGVEADPEMVKACRRRFTAEVERGRLILVNAAIAAEDGIVEFYISEGNRGVWSSLTEEMARRTGLGARRVQVPARRFRGLLERYGVPFYLKIDIEGADRLCLRDVSPTTAPPFLSFEASEGALEDLFWLVNCGYTRFKLIDQLAGFRQVMPPPLHSLRLVHITVSQLTKRVLRSVLRPPTIARALRRRPLAGASASFAISSSGPMPHESDGPWRSLEEVAYAWLYYVKRTTSSNWYDIHAARD